MYKDGSPITYVVLGPKAQYISRLHTKKGITPRFIHQSTSSSERERRSKPLRKSSQHPSS
jgi:hypothetical protein